MKYSNSDNNRAAHPRKQQATISSTVVRCICITASCIVTACGLLGLGVTCFIIRLTDPLAAPCPFLMTLTVFAVAGLLFFVSFVFLLVICRRRNRMRRKDMLEDLPGGCVEEELKPNGDATEESKKSEEKEKVPETAVNCPEEAAVNEDNYEMTQKSADVSLWIEQQKPPEETVDCYPLENRDGATSHETDGEDSEPEITPL